jgi:hypothetical protein
LHKVDIIPATGEHAEHIAWNVRDADREELWASSAMAPLPVMLKGIKHSEEPLTGTVDDTPVCMFGIVADSFIGNIGVPWMVGSNDLDNHAVKFLRRNRAWITASMKIYDRLENYVDVRNTKAINWLGWLGFKFDDPIPYGIFKRDFMRFSMVRSIENV